MIVSVEIAKSHKLYGVGLWLYVYALFLGGVIVLSLYAGFLMYVADFQGNSIAQIVMFSLSSCIPLIILLSLFRRIKFFVPLSIFYQVFLSIMTITGFLGLTGSDGPTRPEIIWLGSLLIAGSVIWILYLLRSRRVKITYGNELGEDELHLLEKPPPSDA